VNLISDWAEDSSLTRGVSGIIASFSAKGLTQVIVDFKSFSDEGFRIF